VLTKRKIWIAHISFNHTTFYYIIFNFRTCAANSCLLRARFDFAYWQSYDDNGERASLNAGEWRGLSLPGTARAIALGMRVRTMSFPSIKGPCFHPARSGDRSFGLVSNAGAMTLPHFAVQTAIHSILPPDTSCASPERYTVEVSCAICSRCNDRSRTSSARIGLNRFKDRDRT